MTRSELIERLAEFHPQLKISDVELAVMIILESLLSNLANGARAEIRGFGSFALNYWPLVKAAIKNLGAVSQFRPNTFHISSRAGTCGSGLRQRQNDIHSLE